MFKSAETLRTLAASSSPFIPIVHTEDAERELTAVYRRLHCIVVRPRNAVDSKPDIALDLLNREAFEKALATMGIEGDEAERLARESGRSPTILRRRLSKIDAIRKPQWAGDTDIARSLIPMALVGAWHARSNADREVVSTLANREYQDIEENITNLMRSDDSPVWSVGEYRGVASKIDALFAISKHVTEANLTNFLRLAEYVLSESNPALELPEDRQWAAAVYGKVRDHSAALREGICETLVLLAVHGNSLFQERLGLDVESHISMLIERLLTPLSLDKLLSHDKDLPNYAEAAPDKFLKLLEADLQQPQPVVLSLLRPTNRFFGGPSRTGLLWALERLAWQHLGRVNLILGQLAGTVIDDNWNNKPITTLQSIYKSWMPQTAASLQDRIQSLQTLIKNFPDIGWQICIDQIQVDSDFATPNDRPRWRNDASGAGRSVTMKEYDEFRLKALEFAFAWPNHDQKTLGDLVERLPGIPEKNRPSVWNLIDEWADLQPDDQDKAELRERIRLSMFTRHGSYLELDEPTKNRSRKTYYRLQPSDPVICHAWLFANPWIDLSEDEGAEEEFCYAKYQEKISKLRTKAMKEIWTECGFEGVTRLLSRNSDPNTVGFSLGRTIDAVRTQGDFLLQCLSITGDLEGQINICIWGFLASMDNETLVTILSTVAEGMDPERTVRLFKHAPFGGNTWRQLDRYNENIQNKYWQEVVPQWNHHSETERIEIIDRLLEAKRPRAAFHAVSLDWQQVETSRLKRLLLGVATIDAEPADWYRLDRHYISKALAALNGRPGISQDEMAQIEFMFIDALKRSEYGIPNLERQIADSPVLFVQALALVFRRNDGGQDPPEWRIEDPKHRSDLGSDAYRLLDRIARIPGTGQDGEINAKALQNWMNEVRQLCVEYGRVEVGNQGIGQLLSKAPAEEDGTWPCLPVCEAMESIASEQISKGFNIGVRNGRGVHTRREGGEQERELAEKYRGWAKLRAFDYPYVSSVLEDIAASYDQKAVWQDNRTKIEKRLGP